MEHTITQSREQLQEQLDIACRLMDRQRELITKLTGQRDELLASLRGVVNYEAQPDFSKWVILIAKAAILVQKVEASK